jgi:PAS domain-containing protein
MRPLIQAIMDAPIDGVLVIDDHGAVQRANAAVSGMFGYSQ